ncbi:hypothetical protein KUTeg_000853 [Tegillarca granosa]|uniref:Profilin n=1 Tax=Tegillarca granosa TaxID=220873 RepID=A0ABQ9FZQ5_TEGGR|nr:hypothetical protein KUTeg_000853 [Tegillarca granosa]
MYIDISWDSYIDNLIGHSKDSAGNAHIDKAAIIGLDGSQWTSQGIEHGININPSEAASIAKCFKNKDFTEFQGNGVKLDGVKYQFLRGEENIALAKKKDHGSVTMQASKSAVVIGHCPEGCQQGNTNKAVSCIAEYLESVNL